MLQEKGNQRCVTAPYMAIWTVLMRSPAVLSLINGLLKIVYQGRQVDCGGLVSTPPRSYSVVSHLFVPPACRRQPLLPHQVVVPPLANLQ